MTAEFFAVMPAIDPEYAYACIDTMCPELRDNLFVIDNSADASIVRSDVYAVHKSGGNLGIASSWNVGLAEARNWAADQCVLISSSIRFGALGGRDLIVALINRAEPHGLATQLGWRCIAVGRACWETIGDFDPVFDPYAFEDTDYLYRLGLAGLPSPRENGGVWPTETIDAECVREAHSLQDGFVHVDYGDQASKYRAKWGGDQGEEMYLRPYFDPTLDYRHTGGPRP